MWKQNRNLVIVVSVLILLVVILTSYSLYKRWQASKALEAGRLERETVLRDLVNTPYEDLSKKDIRTIKDSLTQTGLKDKKLTENERKEVINTLINAPKTISNE